MNYSMIAFAGAFLIGGLAQAGETATVTQDEETEMRFECIQSAIADELEDAQMNSFVEACVSEKLAGRKVI